MIYLSAQPDHKYFHWQLEVQFLNFLDLKIPLSSYYVVCGYKEQPSLELVELKNSYPQVNFIFIKDTRIKRRYIPSIRPHILSKLFLLHPELSREQIFYFDADVIFREELDFSQLQNNDYVSDTDSYLGVKYIEEKGGKRLLREMCRVVGVDVEKVEKVEKHGGAQYFFQPGLTHLFWDKVEEKCVELYSYLLDNNHLYAKEWSEREKKDIESYHEIQSWCSDMWCVFWGLLKEDRVVRVTEEFSFSWGTSSKEEYFRHKIFHNAGVTESKEKELFYKGRFINGLTKSLDLSYVLDTKASFYYSKYVQRIVDNLQ